MDAGAQITVTTGPDEGQTFALSDELVHIGRGADNQIVLTDPALNEHQASIVRRNGRYAIYAPLVDTVEVEGNAIPAERWVWLPDCATIRLGEGTVFQLTRGTTGNGRKGEPERKSEPEEVSTPTPTRRTAKFKSPPKGNGRTRKPKEAKKKSHVARFVSDRSGESLVKLGEDGQLPALELAEISEDRPRERREKPQSSNPLLLYAILGFSFVSSLSLLLLNPGGGSESASNKSDARAVVRKFLGESEDDFEPYQVLLRQALIDHSQGDTRSEQRHYRTVLRMLNSADILHDDLNGLTGRQTGRGTAGDDELRKALQTLLSD